jgi:hypothetical protein
MVSQLSEQDNMQHKNTPALQVRGVSRRASFFADALLWFVWVPASVILLFFVLENFLLSDFLF